MKCKTPDCGKGRRKASGRSQGAFKGEKLRYFPRLLSKELFQDLCKGILLSMMGLSS